MAFSKLWGLFWEAVRATWSAKLRTLLSALCIGLGIAGVTLVTALGAAAIARASEIVETFGSDTLFILSGSMRHSLKRRDKTLTMEDATALRQNFPGAYFVSSMRMIFGMRLSYKNAGLYSEIDGVSAPMALEWNWKVAEGRDFNQDDLEYAANVCLIGSYVRDTLFKNENPLGKYIKVGKFTCEVVGIGEKRSYGAFDDQMNTFVRIPASVFVKKYSWQSSLLMGIRMRFYNASDVDREAVNVEKFLRYRHTLEEDEESDFNILTPSAINKMLFAVLGAIGAFLVAITLVVVVVGGFVTANIFLLAASSRVKEIGIRRAFGATGRDIFAQFIMEFLIIGFCGMAIGLFFGGFAASFISAFGFLQVTLTPTVFFITALASMLIAVAFGILPARSASRISPIEAIRSL